jgi:hypothetical protein
MKPEQRHDHSPRWPHADHNPKSSSATTTAAAAAMQAARLSACRRDEIHPIAAAKGLRTPAARWVEPTGIMVGIAFESPHRTAHAEEIQ